MRTIDPRKTMKQRHGVKRIAMAGLLLCLMTLVIGCTAPTKQVSIIATPVRTTTIRTPNPTPEKTYGYDFESTWGDLITYEGGMVWDTLTRKQQAMVHYPKLDIYGVYWVPKGKSYHAVDWCYTLSKSKGIQQGPLSEAIRKGLDPCSKCVGD